VSRGASIDLTQGRSGGPSVGECAPARIRRAGLVVAAALAGALASAVVTSLALAAPALAAGKVVKVATPLSNNQPAIAVDASGTAYIAWNNDQDPPPYTTDIVQYCVLPAGATACSHSGTLQAPNGEQHIDNVQLLADGSTVVLLADVYGPPGGGTSDYEPEQEWQSIDGGATWTPAQAMGYSVASGIVNADTVPLNALILPGTGELGYGWETADGQPTFNAFPLANPPECSVITCSSHYATLDLDPTLANQLTNLGGAFASQTGTNPGVLGIFDTDATAGAFGCSSAQTVPFGFAFAYGSGTESTGNDYNISPGTAGTAWKVAATLGDCNVEYPAVAGGPSGFGVLEQNDLSKQTVYHRFNPSTTSFNTPRSTVANEDELDPSLSQDGAGGIYATFLGGGSGGPVALSYSANGGSAWAGPATLDHNPGGQIANLTSEIDPAGLGWAAWTAAGAVYAQQFTAADALVPASIGGASASSGGSSATISVSCASFPCAVSVTLSGPATILVHGRNLRRRAHAAKTRTVKLGSGKLTIRSRGSKKLKLKLTRAGRKLLRVRTGTVKLKAVYKTTIQRLTGTATHTIRLRIK
jgi:hypothetical protein